MALAVVYPFCEQLFCKAIKTTPVVVLYKPQCSRHPLILVKKQNHQHVNTKKGNVKTTIFMSFFRIYFLNILPLPMQAKILGSVIFFYLIKGLVDWKCVHNFFGQCFSWLFGWFFGQFFWCFLFQLSSSPDTVHSVGLALEA